MMTRDAGSHGPGSHDAIDFCRALRAGGLAVPVDATVAYVSALGLVDRDRADHVYWAGRSTLVRRPDDIAAYDAAYEAFFRGVDTTTASRLTLEQSVEVGLDIGCEDQNDSDRAGQESEGPDRVVRFSALETLRDRDFATCTGPELHELYRAIDRLAVHGPLRTSPRLIPSTGRTRQLDLRRTVSAALATDGEILRRHHRRRAVTPRRVILLLDISGSMDQYARPMVRFGHAAIAARRRVEVFAMGTRLTRLTRELDTRDPDDALNRVSATVRDWSGGTRLGEGLAAFCDEWGQRGMARGAVVVILSDGWDRGDPANLVAQMTRLRRLAQRIVWVNPLRASDGYEPLARGMAAALPYCDEFVDGHSLSSLESLAALIGGSAAVGADSAS